MFHCFYSGVWWLLICFWCRSPCCDATTNLLARPWLMALLSLPESTWISRVGPNYSSRKLSTKCEFESCYELCYKISWKRKDRTVSFISFHIIFSNMSLPKAHPLKEDMIYDLLSVKKQGSSVKDLWIKTAIHRNPLFFTVFMEMQPVTFLWPDNLCNQPSSHSPTYWLCQYDVFFFFFSFFSLWGTRVCQDKTWYIW